MAAVARLGRATLGGIPVEEQRQILGANAAALYGFDLDLLAPPAQRVGIPVADLAERADNCRRSRTRRSTARGDGQPV